MSLQFERDRFGIAGGNSAAAERDPFIAAAVTGGPITEGPVTAEPNFSGLHLQRAPLRRTLYSGVFVQRASLSASCITAGPSTVGSPSSRCHL